MHQEQSLTLTIGSLYRLADTLGVSLHKLVVTLGLSYSTIYQKIQNYTEKGVDYMDAPVPKHFNEVLKSNHKAFYDQEIQALYGEDVETTKNNMETTQKNQEITKKDMETTKKDMEITKNNPEITKKDPEITQSTTNNASTNTPAITQNVRLATSSDGSTLASYKKNTIFKNSKMLRLLNEQEPVSYLTNLGDAFKNCSVTIYLHNNSLDLHFKFHSKYRYDMVNPLYIEYIFSTESIVILNALNDNRLCIGFSPADEGVLGISYSAIKNIIAVFVKENAGIITIKDTVRDIQKALSNLHTFLGLEVPRNIIENNVISMGNIYKNIQHRGNESNESDESIENNESSESTTNNANNEDNKENDMLLTNSELSRMRREGNKEENKEESTEEKIAKDEIEKDVQERDVKAEASENSIKDRGSFRDIPSNSTANDSDILSIIEKEKTKLSEISKINDALYSYLTMKYPTYTESVKYSMIDEILIFSKQYR